MGTTCGGSRNLTETRRRGLFFAPSTPIDAKWRSGRWGSRFHSYLDGVRALRFSVTAGFSSRAGLAGDHIFSEQLHASTNS